MKKFEGFVDFYSMVLVANYLDGFTYFKLHEILSRLKNHATPIVDQSSLVDRLYLMKKQIVGFTKIDPRLGFWVTDRQRAVDVVTLEWIIPNKDYVRIARFNKLADLQAYVQRLSNLSIWIRLILEIEASRDRKSPLH